MTRNTWRSFFRQCPPSMGSSCSIDGNPKYRICSDPISRRQVVFFCDWDIVHRPTNTFLGKPIYFEDVNTGFLPFTRKNIGASNYVDLAKLKPQLSYLSDLSLKLICLNVAPGLIRDNTESALQSLCLVSTESILEEVCSTCAIERTIEANLAPAAVVKDIRSRLPRGGQLGLVGYHALNPAEEGMDLDLVVLSDDIDYLRNVYEDVAKTRQSSGYIRALWPLTTRTRGFGWIDWFFCTTRAPTRVHEGIAEAKVLDWHHEFEGYIADDALGMLAMPLWRLQDGTVLVTVDGSLRGRLRIGDRVIGVGILARPKGEDPVLVIQLSTNIAVECGKTAGH